jgi:hypothetical protein
MSDRYELNPQERVAVWLTVHAPELREPYGLAEKLLAHDGPLAVDLGDVLDRLRFALDGDE